MICFVTFLRLTQLLNDHGQTTRTIHTLSPPNQSRQSNLTRAPLHNDVKISCPVSTGEASYATSVHHPVSSPHTSAFVQSRVPTQPVSKLFFNASRTVTLSGSHGSSSSHAELEGLNFGNTDDEDRGSSSTDL